MRQRQQQQRQQRITDKGNHSSGSYGQMAKCLQIWLKQMSSHFVDGKMKSGKSCD